MAITAQILNDDASLNSFLIVDAIEFTPGGDITINFRLLDTQEDLRYVPDAGATLSLTFQKTDGTTLVKAASELDTQDRSMWTVSLSQAESALIFGGNIEFDLTEGAKLTKGTIQNALQNVSQSC